jgi:hypothetical protein
MGDFLDLIACRVLPRCFPSLLAAKSETWPSTNIYFKRLHGGAEGDRTPDLCSAIAALSHLSYSPQTRCLREWQGARKVVAAGRT